MPFERNGDMLKRRTMLTGGLAVLGATALPTPAQDFPKGPVKIIIPFPPGGPTDTVGRLIAQHLQELWGQTVLIDYKAGAGTIIGVDFVAKSAPDGMTFGMVNSALAVNPSLHKTMPYRTPQDIAGITQIANLQLALVARPDAPFNTLPELIAHAKKNPGKLVYGTPGAGSTTHLSMELLQRENGIEMLHSPFKGSAPAHTELMGGRIDLVADPFLSIIPYVKAGRMKMIATMGSRQVPVTTTRLPRRRCPASTSTRCSASSRRPPRRRPCCRRSRPTPRACSTCPRCASVSRSSAPKLSRRSRKSSMPSSPPRCSAGAASSRTPTSASNEARGSPTMSLRLKPLHPVFAAEASGIDLTRPISIDEAKAVNAAMNEHAVLVFRGQPLTAQQQVTFATSFGPLDIGLKRVFKRPERLDDERLIDIIQRRCDRRRRAPRFAEEPVELRQPALA
jgi:tripartite-type tricarboxylate transporter receptor subunit TctC